MCLKTFAWMLVSSLSILTCATLHAGSGVQVECGDADCQFNDTVLFSGGMDEIVLISGYCRICEQVVGTSWNPREDESPPAPYSVIDTRTGKLITPVVTIEGIPPSGIGRTEILYPCPMCKAPFFPIRSAEDLKCCPKCGKPELQHANMTLWD